MPGRYKHELQPKTIEVINKKLEPCLRKMAEYDPDYAHLYLEGLSRPGGVVEQKSAIKTFPQKGILET